MGIEIRIKRIYEVPISDDVCRILVDRLWPRGVTKQVAKIDIWAKELTPSHELRTWFHADPNRQVEFAHCYLTELVDRQLEINGVLESLAKYPVLTLVTASKDLEAGHTEVLKSYLLSQL